MLTLVPYLLRPLPRALALVPEELPIPLAAAKAALMLTLALLLAFRAAEEEGDDDDDDDDEEEEEDAPAAACWGLRIFCSALPLVSVVALVIAADDVLFVDTLTASS